MIPNDANILFSFINTKLRDEYSTLDEFCAANMCSIDEICDKLDKIGYYYDDKLNKFVFIK